jgi:hypothetical protein
VEEHAPEQEEHIAEEEDLVGMEEGMEEQMVLEKSTESARCSMRKKMCITWWRTPSRISARTGYVHGYTPRKKVRRPAVQCVFYNFLTTSLLSCG